MAKYWWNGEKWKEDLYNGDSVVIDNHKQSLPLQAKIDKIRPLIKQFVEQLPFSERMEDVIDLLYNGAFRADGSKSKYELPEKIALLAILSNDLDFTYQWNQLVNMVKQGEKYEKRFKVKDLDSSKTKIQENTIDYWFADKFFHFNDVIVYYTLSQDFKYHKTLNEDIPELGLTKTYGKMYSQTEGLFDTYVLLKNLGYSQRDKNIYKEYASLLPMFIRFEAYKTTTVEKYSTKDKNTTYPIFKWDAYNEGFNTLIEPTKQVIGEEFVLMLDRYLKNIYKSSSKELINHYKKDVRTLIQDGIKRREQEELSQQEIGLEK